MINSKRELNFYILADRIMNGWSEKKNILRENKFISGDRVFIIKYLEHLRKYAYYKNRQKNFFSFNTIAFVYEHFRVASLSLKTGFTIGENSLGYGALLPHHGTIIVNGEAKIGNFAVIHTCTCVAGGGKNIGDGLYLGTGSQIVGNINIGNNVSVAAHSLVNKSCDDNVLLAGVPSVVKKDNYQPWYERDGEIFIRRVLRVDTLHKEFLKTK